MPSVTYTKLKETLDSTTGRLKMEKKMGHAKSMELDTLSKKTTSQKEGYLISVSHIL